LLLLRSAHGLAIQALFELGQKCGYGLLHAQFWMFPPDDCAVSHPTRLAFEGVAWLALLTAALAGAYSWRDKAPAWGLILGFALLWILGALGTYFLHRSFNRSAGT